MEPQRRKIRPRFPPGHSRIMKREAKKENRSGEQHTPRNRVIDFKINVMLPVSYILLKTIKDGGGENRSWF